MAGGRRDADAFRDAVRAREDEIEAAQVERRGRQLEGRKRCDVRHQLVELRVVEQPGEQPPARHQEQRGERTERGRPQQRVRDPETGPIRLARDEVDEALCQSQRQDEKKRIREEPGLLERAVTGGQEHTRQHHRNGEREHRHPEARQHQRARPAQDRPLVHPDFPSCIRGCAAGG